jgi:hypothetical protein
VGKNTFSFVLILTNSAPVPVPDNELPFEDDGGMEIEETDEDRRRAMDPNQEKTSWNDFANSFNFPGKRPSTDDVIGKNRGSGQFLWRLCRLV